MAESLPVDPSRRDFLKTAAGLMAGLGSVCALTPLLGSWMPNVRTQKNTQPITVDLSHLQPGELMTVEWSGQPIFILHRTPAMIRAAAHLDPDLRDPHSLTAQQPRALNNTYRSIHPDFLVLVGLCTHLGCVPHYDPAQPDGFHCPCHGSSFDLAGRVFKNVPAPLNLMVPPHRFIRERVVLIGESS